MRIPPTWIWHRTSKLPKDLQASPYKVSPYKVSPQGTKRLHHMGTKSLQRTSPHHPGTERLQPLESSNEKSTAPE